MITVDHSAGLETVARHYDELDVFYRAIWGEHVHHGLWQHGNESVEEAVEKLVDVVAAQAGVCAGSQVCDIGCGYGATARQLVRMHNARVTALTIATRQYEFARNVEPTASNPEYLLRDWLENRLPAATFDAAIAIESTEHMPDLRGAFREVARVLKPGGRLVVCAWLAAPRPRSWEVRHLLRPICVEGRLPGMATASEYQELIEDAGLTIENVADLTAKVRRTWWICLWRAVKEVCRRPEWRRYLRDARNADRLFARTLFRILLAYRVGAMRYGMFTARLR